MSYILKTIERTMESLFLSKDEVMSCYWDDDEGDNEAYEGKSEVK